MPFEFLYLWNCWR